MVSSFGPLTHVSLSMRIHAGETDNIGLLVVSNYLLDIHVNDYDEHDAADDDTDNDDKRGHATGQSPL